MAPTFSEFTTTVIVKSRGSDGPAEVDYRVVEVHANNMTLKFPCQLFINGEFVDAENGKAIPIVNPTDESIICEVNFDSFKVIFN